MYHLLPTPPALQIKSRLLIATLGTQALPTPVIPPLTTLSSLILFTPHCAPDFPCTHAALALPCLGPRILWSLNPHPHAAPAAPSQPEITPPTAYWGIICPPYWGVSLPKGSVHLLTPTPPASSTWPGTRQAPNIYFFE